jgi:crotonobetainyl-CoA:carnitine CoA-transferase CaiB-like acyl-CoA transferase
MQRTLEGIRVLDFSRYVAGAYCGALLADMGAEVLRVERHGGEADRKLGPFLWREGRDYFFGGLRVKARNPSFCLFRASLGTALSEGLTSLLGLGHSR